MQAETAVTEAGRVPVIGQGRLTCLVCAVQVLARDPRENNSSKYCILRALNGLLKRLSKAQDLQVCVTEY